MFPFGSGADELEAEEITFFRDVREQDVAGVFDFEVISAMFLVIFIFRSLDATQTYVLAIRYG